MIKTFGDQATRDVYDGKNTKKARKKIPRDTWTRARRKLDMIEAANKLNDLRGAPGNRLEKLEGYENRWSIRINDQYRIVFDWSDGDAENVEITDYH